METEGHKGVYMDFTSITLWSIIKLNFAYCTYRAKVINRT